MHPTLPAICVGGYLSRSCNVHLILRPAISVGVTDWVSPSDLATDTGAISHKQFRTAVSGQVPPGCYHRDAPSTYSAKWDLAEPDSFHSGRNKLQTSYTTEITERRR